MKKTELRKQILEQRKQLSPEERRAKSRIICERILCRDDYRKAKRIFVYVSMGAEAETQMLIEQAWKDGKMVAVPKTAAKRKMYFLPIRSFAELRKSNFGVYEPTGRIEEAWIPQEDDLFLVPIVGFDRKKNRIGYGGGYYDRYFAEQKGIRKIGLAFQMQEALFSIEGIEETDIPLDEIITENDVIV